MARGGRSLARFWRRLRRPTFPRLVAASLAIHLVAIVLTVWWAELPRGTVALPPPPLVVELPPAAPGRPLVRPEAPAPPPRPAPPAATARAPRPPTPEPPTPARPPAALPPSPAAPVPAPPPPPAVARPVEPAPAAPAPEPPIPAPAPPVAGALAAPPAPEALPPPLPAPATPEAPPTIAARPSEPRESPEPAPRPAPERAPAPPEPPRTEGDSPFSGRTFSLLRPEIEPLPAPRVPGSGGSRPEGDGAGEAGRLQDGQVAIPLTTPDPRYAEYFIQVKKRIEAHWAYPREAARKDQAGQGLAGFVLKRDGTVRDVQILRSTGFEILDRYLVNAIRLAQPFPPIPDRIGENALPVSLTYTYILDSGFRIFGFR